MSEKALRIGPIAGVFGLWAVLSPIFVDLAFLLAIPRLPLELVAFVPHALMALGALSVLVGALALVRLRTVDGGVKGRARIYFGAVAMVIGAAAKIMIGVLLLLVFGDPGFGALGEPLGLAGMSSPVEQARSAVETVAYGLGIWGPLLATFVVLGVATRVQLLAGISTWFLIPMRVRRVLWILLDIPLLAAFVFALWALPFTPRAVPGQDEADVTLPAIALAITTLFALRAFARMLPPVLDVIERGGFQTLVAARMLRARKSGFLTAIGLLSVLAVSFSSCTLTTTLSVMGGFREDLQRKILGNNAHVVIDREYGTFEGWDPLLGRVREVEGVQGASPYVAGEVMVTSASNLGGAVLRGIDPTTIGDVTDLPRNMRHGRLEYLSDPERLLHLTVDEMSGSLLGTRPPPPPLPPLDVDSPSRDDVAEDGTALPRPMRDEPLGDPDATSLLRDIDRILAQLPADDGEPEITTGSGARVEVQDAFGAIDDPDSLFLRAPPPLQRPRDVLPGLIVGQELARSLRLHVGDEVNVVSPLGDLGPAGPIPKSRPFRVAGIFYSGMYEYDMKVAYTDLATAQRFLSTGDAISGIEVRVDDWERAELAAAEIAQAIARPNLRVRSWQEVNRNLFGALELEKLAMFITLGIAILVASFCIVGTLVLMVQEKGREVGILKAMGAEDKHIVAVFMLQGLFIGVVGAATGLGLGWVVCFAAEHLGIVPLNPEVYYIDSLPIHTDPREFLAVGVAAVLVCLLATIYPAILGSRLKPVDALRYA
ncbi:MAG: FtsX-like permease family protein [Myxococcota bacterium]|nr:FtsX-like permease family protein [Myxococcota bacterium]